MPDIPVSVGIVLIIISIPIVLFIIDFMVFFSSVPKELKRIADALEKISKNKEKK